MAQALLANPLYRLRRGAVTVGRLLTPLRVPALLASILLASQRVRATVAELTRRLGATIKNGVRKAAAHMSQAPSVLGHLGRFVVRASGMAVGVAKSAVKLAVQPIRMVAAVVGGPLSRVRCLVAPTALLAVGVPSLTLPSLALAAAATLTGSQIATTEGAATAPTGAALSKTPEPTAPLGLTTEETNEIYGAMLTLERTLPEVFALLPDARSKGPDGKRAAEELLADVRTEVTHLQELADELRSYEGDGSARRLAADIDELMQRLRPQLATLEDQTDQGGAPQPANRAQRRAPANRPRRVKR